VQEPSSINVVDDTTLEPGMVLTPEPRYMRDGTFVMVEENVVITPTGAERLYDAGGYERMRQIRV
jgi:Xaa-Pro aminopeptidase